MYLILVNDNVAHKMAHLEYAESVARLIYAEDPRKTVIVVREDATPMYELLSPVPGMPATMNIGSDRYPGIVISTSYSKKTVFFGRNDRDDMKFTMRKDGRYRRVGGNAYTLTLGIAVDYRDPHV